jgi:hypothetical protein
MLTSNEIEDEIGAAGNYEPLNRTPSELLAGEQRDRTILKVNVPIKSGNSGGPVLAIVDGVAQVVGIADKSNDDFYLGNIATPSSFLVQDLDALHKDGK